MKTFLYRTNFDRVLTGQAVSREAFMLTLRRALIVGEIVVELKEI